MCAQADPNLAFVSLSLKAVLKLFDQVALIRRGPQKSREQILNEITKAAVEHLSADRCLVLLSPLSERLFDKSEVLCLTVASEGCAPVLKPVSVRNHEISKDSELGQACLRGKPLVIREVRELSARMGGSYGRSDQFLSDCERESILFVPLVRAGSTAGCLTLHFLNRPVPAVDFYLEVGQALADELAAVLELGSSTVRKVDLSEQANPQLSEDMTQVLSKQLGLVRWTRQTIIRMHSTLDKDVVLQQVADAVGRGLNASRCLIVRTDSTPSGVVTHEYAEAEVSPLGLGRTDQLPLGLIEYFKQNVGSFLDLADLSDLGGLSIAEVKSLSDNAVSAVAGAPIVKYGTNLGAIILLQCGLPKPWTAAELEALALMAEQTAVALGHCESFLQLKDQLFNMSLIGNLTQQLTSTLEIVAKSIRVDSNDEKARQALETAPLSFRELEVLRLIASGYANREIAKRLFLTESTVELHASRIRKKLNLKSRTALVKYACDNSLV